MLGSKFDLKKKSLILTFVSIWSITLVKILEIWFWLRLNIWLGPSLPSVKKKKRYETYLSKHVKQCGKKSNASFRRASVGRHPLEAAMKESFTVSVCLLPHWARNTPSVFGLMNVSACFRWLQADHQSVISSLFAKRSDLKYNTEGRNRKTADSVLSPYQGHLCCCGW